MSAEEDKELYENLDILAVESPSEYQAVGVRSDMLAEVLKALSGLRWVDDDSANGGRWIYSETRRDAAERVARRWLFDSGYVRRLTSDYMRSDD